MQQVLKPKQMTAADKSYVRRKLQNQVKSLEVLVAENRKNHAKSKMGTARWKATNTALMYAELNLAAVRKQVQEQLDKL